MSSTEIYDLIKTLAPQIITASIALYSYWFLARQGREQRRTDYLRDQQRLLREAKAQYDGWIPVSKPEDAENQRNGLYQLSIAKGVMCDVLNEDLETYANRLNLNASTQPEHKANQVILEEATQSLAQLLAKSWKVAKKETSSTSQKKAQ